MRADMLLIDLVYDLVYLNITFVPQYLGKISEAMK